MLFLLRSWFKYSKDRILILARLLIDTVCTCVTSFKRFINSSDDAVFWSIRTYELINHCNVYHCNI